MGKKMSFLATIFGRDLIFHDSEKEVREHTIKRLRVGSHSFEISSEIIDLLWFGDGRKKNTEEFEDSSIPEPSEIFTHDQVYRDTPEKLSSYPSFSGLTPGQKYHFFAWLEDIDRKDDIGYAFLLLYALERRLYMGSMVEPAIDLLSRLHQNIDDEEFLRQSSDALVWAAYKYKRTDFLNCLRKAEMPQETQVLVKLYTHGHLNARDIMLISDKLGMENQRYITGKPRLFEKMLADRLQEKYDEDLFSINNLEHAGKCDIKISLSNFSLPKDKRHVKVPNLLVNKDIKKPLLKMLEQTSEDVRIELTGHYK